VPPLQQAEQIIVSGGQAPFTGRQTFQIVARIQGHERRIPIEADVSALPRAVVAVRPIARGGVIRPEDIETKAVAADVVTSERLLARDEIVGREAIKGLIVGQPITASQVQLPRLVHRGDKVMVHSLAAGVSITTSGKATEDGALGEAIAVELEDPKRQIQARVAGPLRVEIGVAGTPHRAAAVEPPTAISLQPAGNTP
jgi:flagella basal body P-ring formation protein FlgA